MVSKVLRNICPFKIVKPSVSCFGCWLFGFYGISNFVCYLMPNPFYTNDQFYFKQFSLILYIVQFSKPFVFQAIQFSQTVLIQTIQFSISIDFVYT